MFTSEPVLERQKYRLEVKVVSDMGADDLLLDLQLNTAKANRPVVPCIAFRPLLEDGVHWSRQTDGTSPEDRDFFKSWVRKGESSDVSWFNSLPAISSGPLALKGLMLDSNF